MHLPHQRNLTAEEKAEAEKLLGMKANKKMVQHKLTQETGKIVLLEDLTNISTSMKQRDTQNDLDATVGMLTNKYGKL